MDQQYDVSPEMKKLFDIKQKQRAEAKEYFQKLLYNPYRPLGDGVPFDPSMMRFNATCAYQAYLYPKTPAFYFKVFVLLSPIFFVYYGVDRYKKQKEMAFRSGLISYEERFNKFLM